MWMSKRSETISARRATRRGLRPSCELLEGRALLATFQVVDVAGLQAAVAAVNADPSRPATIEVAPGTYHLTSELEFDFTAHLKIEGSPSGTVILDNPTHSDRIFKFFKDGDVTVEGLVITGGSTSLRSFDYNGGGIDAEGTTLTLSDCTISSNSADFYGGGIYVDGATLTLDHSTISGNSSSYGSAGIYIGACWQLDRHGQHDLRQLGAGITSDIYGTADGKRQHDLRQRRQWDQRRNRQVCPSKTARSPATRRPTTAAASTQIKPP